MTTKPEVEVDPVTFAVLVSRFQYVAWAIRDVMLMSSRSSILSVVQDYSTGIFNGDGEIIMLPDLLPIQMCQSDQALKPVIQAYAGDIEEGDLFVNNSPYHGNGHVYETNLFCPVFYEGELLFWTMDRPHYMDMGASEPSTVHIFARDVYQEGIHLPPFRVGRKHHLDEHWVEFFLANTRYHASQKGDLLACVGSVWHGERLLHEICRKYGKETVKTWLRQWMAYGDQRVTEEIRKLPKGTWYCEDRLDPWPGLTRPEGIILRLQVTIDPEAATITFDGRECDEQVPFGGNTSRASFGGGCMEGLLTCLDPTLPRNGGAYQRFQFITRKGTVVDPNYPAATAAASTLVPDRLANMVMKLFAEITGGDRGSAGMGMEGCSIGLFVGQHPKTGEPYGATCFVSNAGGPGMQGYDGWPGLFAPACMGVMLYEPIELHELLWPHMVSELTFPMDSSSPGQWRGGPSVLYDIGPLYGDFQVYGFGDGLVNPPGGVLEGWDGSVCWHRIIDRKTRKVVRDCWKQMFELVKPGEAWQAFSNPGGGFGDPLNRDPELVRWDVREELVSPRAAREVYGVTLDYGPETYAVDYEATRKLREELGNIPAEERKRQLQEQYRREDPERYRLQPSAFQWRRIA